MKRSTIIIAAIDANQTISEQYEGSVNHFMFDVVMARSKDAELIQTINVPEV